MMKNVALIHSYATNNAPKITVEQSLGEFDVPTTSVALLFSATHHSPLRGIICLPYVTHYALKKRPGLRP